MFQKYEANGQSTVHADEVKPVPSFDDPVAAITGWDSIQKDGASFQTHTLQLVSPSRYEFRANAAAKRFCAIPLVLSPIAMIIGICIVRLMGLTWSPPTWVPFGLGLMFALGGSWMLYATTKPIVFDLQHQYFVRGRQLPERSEDFSKLKNCAELGRIHALQLISKFSYHKGGEQYSMYELNLVLNDASRINVTSQGGSLEANRADAQKLAAFLGKPLWDAI